MRRFIQFIALAGLIAFVGSNVVEAMPPMPKGVEDGILKGLYKFKPGPNISPSPRPSDGRAGRGPADA